MSDGAVEPARGPLKPAISNTNSVSVPAACLNCGTTLEGPFCSRCGQRAIGAYPTVSDMIGDAWQELSGWDGRLARTVRLLLLRPGALTVEAMEGRRVRYVSPVRLYLLASLAYFLCAVSVPNLRTIEPVHLPGSDEEVIRMDPSGRLVGLTGEQREQALKNLERAPWWAQAVMRPVLLDPEAFRLGFMERLPRVLFVLVPVFAGIVALFYWRRPFPQHLVFAVHLHAVIFIVLTLRELSQLTRSAVILDIFELAATATIVAYSLIAFRRVYRESWWRVLPKAIGIAFVYAIAGITALLATTIWVVAFN